MDDSTWLDEIFEALESLGGEAQLRKIYERIEQRTKRKLPRNWRQTVYGQIGKNSPDSKLYLRKNDLFRSVHGIKSRAGYWRLNHWRLSAELRDTSYVEGKGLYVVVNRYERNLQARNACIQELGAFCHVCGFHPEDKYGESGKATIEVHHLVPLSNIGDKYEVNPEKDLVPVCANCHNVIHSRQPIYTIEEAKELLLKGSQP